MSQENRIICPVCKANHFTLKYQATYEYSYRIDEDAPGIQNTQELLPYMYDNRTQKESKQYLECEHCKTVYPCYFNLWTENSTLDMMQEAIDAAYETRKY